MPSDLYIFLFVFFVCLIVVSFSIHSVFFHRELSLSMSLSMSYLYDSDGNDDTNTDGGDVPTDTDDTPVVSDPDGDSSPSDLDTTDPPVTVCAGLPFQPLTTNILVQSVSDSLSVATLKNALNDRLRDTYAFCDDLNQRRLQNNTSDIDDADSVFYIGDIDLEQLDEGKYLCLLILSY